MATKPTLNAASAEAAIVELTEFLADKQTTTAKNPNNRSVVTAFSRNNTTGAINITLALTSSTSIDTNGNLVVDVDEVYLD